MATLRRAMRWQYWWGNPSVWLRQLQKASCRKWCRDGAVFRLAVGWPGRRHNALAEVTPLNCCGELSPPCGVGGCGAGTERNATVKCKTRPTCLQNHPARRRFYQVKFGDGGRPWNRTRHESPRRSYSPLPHLAARRPLAGQIRAGARGVKAEVAGFWGCRHWRADGRRWLAARTRPNPPEPARTPCQGWRRPLGTGRGCPQ